MEEVLDKVKIEKYSAYKDSGAEWMGEIPNHWNSIRMKHLFRDVSIKNKSDAELLSVTQDQGVVPRTWVENRMVMPSGALGSFKFISEGDFAISLRSFEGGLEYCYHDGIISPAYTVLKTQRNFDSQFYKYLFKSSSFISELQTSVVGIRQGKNISYEELSYSFVPIPLIEEQTAIAQFLDRKTAQIDQAIAQKEKQIELLKERRQILIHKAVTRGLNPQVKMKDSGVEWIGEIPFHWAFIKLGYFIEILSGYAFTSSGFSNESGIKLLRGINIGVGNIRWNDVVYWPENKMQNLEPYFLNEDDIVFGMDRPLIAEGLRISTINKEDLPCLLLQRVTRIRAAKGLLQEYLILILKSKSFSDYFMPILSGVSVPHISPNQIQSFKIGIPDPEEQESIISYITTQSTKISSAISIKEKEIEKLKECKAILINSAVTGKIKVC
jgi:type I restriction enzyme S subunit